MYPFFCYFAYRSLYEFVGCETTQFESVIGEVADRCRHCGISFAQVFGCTGLSFPIRYLEKTSSQLVHLPRISIFIVLNSPLKTTRTYLEGCASNNTGLEAHFGHGRRDSLPVKSVTRVFCLEAQRVLCSWFGDRF